MKPRFAKLLAVLVLVVAQAPWVRAEDLETCLGRRFRYAYSPELLAEALEEVPGLRKIIMEMMEDPGIPRSLKAIIKQALQNERTEVVSLTEEIRASWNVPKWTWAFVLQKPSDLPYWTYRGVTETANETFSRVATPKFKSGHGVAVPDQQVRPGLDGLLTLIHELAHVRFEAMFQKRFPEILARFPDSYIMNMADGK